MSLVDTAHALELRDVVPIVISLGSLLVAYIAFRDIRNIADRSVGIAYVRDVGRWADECLRVFQRVNNLVLANDLPSLKSAQLDISALYHQGRLLLPDLHADQADIETAVYRGSESSDVLRQLQLYYQGIDANLAGVSDGVTPLDLRSYKDAREAFVRNVRLIVNVTARADEAGKLGK